jgi:transcriptional regulator with XRE-family HTH domain
MIDKSFGHMLKVTRLALGYDQSQFAKELEISQATYSRYEKGRTEPPLGLVIKLYREYKFPAFLLFADSLDEYIKDIPFDYFAYLIYENNYDFNPLRVKSPKRKYDDIAKRLSEAVSLVWFVRDFYSQFRNRHFHEALELNEYDIEKVEQYLNNAIKVFNLDNKA